MAIEKIVSSVIRGLNREQAPKLIQSIARQGNLALDARTLKTGVIGNYLVGCDQAGRFIATQGSKLPNGNFGTISRYGNIEGSYLKIVSENGGKTERGFFEELVNKLKLNFNMDRTKTGVVNGTPIAIEWDSGRFVIATMKEKLPNGEFGVNGQIGKIEGTLNKEVPKEHLY